MGPKPPFSVPVVWDLQLPFQQVQDRAIPSPVAIVTANILGSLRHGFGYPSLTRYSPLLPQIEGTSMEMHMVTRGMVDWNVARFLAEY